MTQLELKGLVASLTAEERRRLRELLDDLDDDDPVYRLAELSEQLTARGGVPRDFAANHDRYIHGRGDSLD